MPVSLPNTATANAYPIPGAGGAQAAGTDVFASGWFIVANAAAFGEFVYGIQGQYELSPEMFLSPGNYPIQASQSKAISGIRFRSAVAGVPAQVFGTFFYPTDPTLQAASEFTSTVSTTGGVTPPSGGAQLTGQITSGGGITAGTGFTVAHGGTGLYTVTFTTPFAATPTIVTTIFDSGGSQHHAMDITAQSAAAFSVKITDNVGTPVDTFWNFLATTTV